MEAVEKIHAFERFGSILGLERMNRLLELLENPQNDLKVIHVAGTNGKGSVCRYIYCALRKSGYSTGIYISPFLEKFNERIEVDGEYISDEDLELYTDKVLEKVSLMTEEGDQSPTEFEVITAIAFLYFKARQCDFVVLETGLGGRGDSTNVCRKPLATVITSISYDHMDRLGNTLAEIAGEKAGIIKDGSMVITGAESDEALDVIRRQAAVHNAPCTETAGVPYTVSDEGLWGSRFHADLNLSPYGGDMQIKSFDAEISMAGRHQIRNAIIALTTLCLLRETGTIEISDEAMLSGLKEAKQAGRLEVLRDEHPMIIIDGAHNEDGAHSLRSAVMRHCAGMRILMAVGVLADKDVDGILSHFTRITCDFITTEPDNPRKLSAEVLAQKIKNAGPEYNVLGIEKDPRRALDLALKKGEEYDAILFAGSLYMIGAVRSGFKEL